MEPGDVTFYNATKLLNFTETEEIILFCVWIPYTINDSEIYRMQQK
jgi:hypothetical protein